MTHAEGCKRGGDPVSMHNTVRGILWRFVKERIDPNALREQRLEALRAPSHAAAAAAGEEEDRLDVCFSYAGKQYNVDVGCHRGGAQ